MISKVQVDFDQIALLEQDGWNHNNHYHGFLLKQIGAKCGDALDLGCGTGAFARLLAQRASRVLGLDLSPRMIEIAKERSQEYPNITYHVGDVMALDLPAEHYDCIVSIATLHHLPFQATLLKLKSALKAAGTLLILDLFEHEGIGDTLRSAVALPPNILLRLVKNGRLRESPAVREAWAEHGKTDTYLPLSQIRRECLPILPGALIRKHLFWRYSIVWKKPR